MGAINLKLELYHCLLQIPHTMLSESEVDIMYALSKDEEVQTHINIKTKSERISNYG